MARGETRHARARGNLHSILLCILAVGCGGPGGAPDAGAQADAGTSRERDAGQRQRDSGAPDAATTTETDGGSDLPPNPGPDGLYLGIQPDLHPTVTPRNSPVVWGSAPPIDASYGGTLYVGTALEQPDPRPPLLSDGNEPLRLWVADPNDGRTDRPAILWLHGGGFAVGIDSMYGLANTVGLEYAERGYVGFSVEYRSNTVLIGDTARPPSECQWVQDNPMPGDPTWEARHDECVADILAAQRDVLAAVRWVRMHAAEYGVDPSKIALGGFSAGAVLTANAAYESDDVGDHAYFDGDDLSAEASRARAAIGASGCTYSEDGSPPPWIGAGDVPISFIHAEQDGAVPYACAALMVNTARMRGLVAELTSYCGSDQSLHAAALYDAYKDDTDAQWTTFLARELGIYSGMRPPSADPTCP